MSCPFYRGDLAPRCTAVAGCLPAREIDRKRMCLTERFDRCALYSLREILAAPVDAALAGALRDKDLDRRRGRLLATTTAWLKGTEPLLLVAAPTAERLPAQALLADAVLALGGAAPAASTRVVVAPELCGVFDRVARALRVIAVRAPDERLAAAASVLEIGAGLLPSGRNSLSW
jgi:hypothetical protein